MPSLPQLLREVAHCRTCEAHLPHGPRPVVQAHPSSRILIIGQAPGRRVHESGIPWNDPSGDNLRRWMGIDRDTFYDPKTCALVPMGFCYPGTGKSGDLPPRKECAPQWHPQLLPKLKHVGLTLLIGQYAQTQYLTKTAYPNRGNLTDTVKNWRTYATATDLPGTTIPLPHPSPRNIRWQKANPWFEKELVPALQHHVLAQTRCHLSIDP